MVDRKRICVDDVGRRQATADAQAAAAERAHQEWATGVDPMSESEAFTLLFRSTGHNERERHSAATKLRGLSPEEFTQTAIRVMRDGGVPPVTGRFSWRKKTGFLRKEPRLFTGWKFDVTRHFSESSEELVVGMDGRWAASGRGGDGYQSYSGFASREFSRDSMDWLIDAACRWQKDVPIM